MFSQPHASVHYVENRTVTVQGGRQCGEGVKMAEDVLRLERRERIAILTLNRPDRLNALSVELREALVRACQELRDDDDIWAVVLTGAGRGFCSGVDLRPPRPDSEQAASRQA